LFKFDSMAPDNKIDELLEKIAALSSSVDQCHEEIARLKSEIAGLKKRRPVATASSKTNSFTLENFVGLKLIHFVGIIVLIIGLTIGVKYAIDINLVSPALRIILAYVAGIALFLLSLKLREKYERFSSILFSGAMASAYFTTYAAFAYYSMLPAPVAFAIMLLLTIFTVYQALQYNRPEIAMLGLIGAYGIPFFVRGNSDNITGLFSYIFLINLGMLFLSFKKYWLSLNYLGFFTTWIIYFSCLYHDPEGRHYHAELFFAIAFYILFTLSTLGFKLYRRYDIQYSDSIIIILNAASLYCALSILFSGDVFEFNAGSAGICSGVFYSSSIIKKISSNAAAFNQRIVLGEHCCAHYLFSFGVRWFCHYHHLGSHGHRNVRGGNVLQDQAFSPGRYCIVCMYIIEAVVFRQQSVQLTAKSDRLYFYRDSIAGGFFFISTL